MIITKDLTSSGCSVDALKLYTRLHKCANPKYTWINVNHKKTPDLCKDLVANGFEQIYGRFKANECFGGVYEKGTTIVDIGGHESIYIYHQDNIADLIKLVSKYKKKKSKSKINILSKTRIGFQLMEFESRKVKVNEGSYEINHSIDSIENMLKQDKPGLVLFSGAPGTGKTFLIRHFLQKMDRKFVFIPNDMVRDISDPSFIGFAVEELKDSVLIIEDAETSLADRKGSGTSAVSVLLNITDGLLGDLLNLKIVATINNEEMVDPAMLRRGRLLAKVEFKALPVAKANELAAKLGKSYVDKDTLLTDLYNNDNGIVKETKHIGFSLVK